MCRGKVPVRTPHARVACGERAAVQLGGPLQADALPELRNARCVRPRLLCVCVFYCIGLCAGCGSCFTFVSFCPLFLWRCRACRADVVRAAPQAVCARPPTTTPRWRAAVVAPPPKPLSPFVFSCLFPCHSPTRTGGCGGGAATAARHPPPLRRPPPMVQPRGVGWASPTAVWRSQTPPRVSLLPRACRRGPLPALPPLLPPRHPRAPRPRSSAVSTDPGVVVDACRPAAEPGWTRPQPVDQPP